MVFSSDVTSNTIKRLWYHWTRTADGASTILHAEEQIAQLVEVLRPYATVNETLVETVQCLLDTNRDLQDALNRVVQGMYAIIRSAERRTRTDLERANVTSEVIPLSALLARWYAEDQAEAESPPTPPKRYDEDQEGV